MSRARLLLVALLAASCSASPPARSVVVQPAAAQSWVMFRGDPARDGHPLGATLTPRAAPRLRLAWSVELGEVITGGPVVAGGMVYAGTLEGTLVALSTESGKTVWKQTGLEPLSGQLLVTADTVYVGSASGRLYAFDAQAGTPAWDWRAPGAQPEISGGPVLDRGLLVVGVGGGSSDPGRLVALDPASGDRVWASCLTDGCDPGNEFDSSVALDPAGYGFVGTGRPVGSLASFDAGIGRLRWRSPLGDAVAATPLLFLSHARERVADGSLDGSFAVFDAATGRTVWSRRLGGGVAGSPGFDGHALYAPIASGGLEALGPDDGSLLWSSGSEPIDSSPAIGLGVVVVGDRAGLLALAALDGRELWRAETDSPVIASPAIVGEDVFAADRGGQVLAFRPSA